MGIHPVTLSRHVKDNPAVKALVALVDEKVHHQVTDIGEVIQALEVKALAKVHDLMEHGSNQKIQLDAAKDLLDRGTRTSKVQKIQSTNFHMTAQDAAMLAEKVAEARMAREIYAAQVDGGWDKIEKRTGTEG